jgi:hypothetical protein
MKSWQNLFKATALSILIFLSISFLTILVNIAPFRFYENNEMYKMEIGFPFTYYSQFWVGNSIFPNFGWNVPNLLLDCLLTWVFIVGIYFWFKQKK